MYAATNLMRFTHSKYHIDAKTLAYSPVHGNCIMGQTGNFVTVWGHYNKTDRRVRDSRDHIHTQVQRAAIRTSRRGGELSVGGKIFPMFPSVSAVS